jgi:mannosyltransferase OCH1-like enzyme
MIPNIFHFIYFYGLNKEFPLAHYININAARILNSPDEIIFYSDSEPSGLYWEKIKKYITFQPVNPPQLVFGNKLYHIAHKSDVLRLEILKKSGGIYLDLDVICKKSFKDLMNNDFVMGKQGKYRNMGLCNGVILTDKNSEFLKLWYEEFRNFRSRGKDKYWAEMSVRKPLELSKKHPELIHVEPYNSFHYPLYYSFDLKKLFVKNLDFKNAYCHHYWDGASWDKYLKNLTEDGIRCNDTTYNVIARKYL